MKFIGKLLVYLLVALLLVLLALYFLLQTRWGASQVSSWVTVNTDYELSFDLMDHRFRRLPTSFWKTSPLVATVSPPHWWLKVDIGLGSRQFTDPLHMDTITGSMAR